MKTRTSLSKENSSSARKPKKCVRKERPHPKTHTAVKKPRPPVQQNRFTNILELPTLSASLMQLQDFFGTLVLDFGQDPVQVKISDVTGNYELNVSKESLSEFKLKVLLGQNSKGKPAFTIFLGECQCYPEHPEGALEWNDSQNDKTVSQIESFGDENRIAAKDDGGPDEVEKDTGNAPAKHIRNDSQHEISEADDIAAPLLSLFEGFETDVPEASTKKDLVTYETHHISINDCPQKLGPLSNSDELIVKVRPKRVSTKIRKPQKKPDTTAVRRAHKKRSTYRNNLEGFVKFLMTDRVCGSLLDKMKAPDGVTQLAKRTSGQKLVNYCDGKEYRALFSREKNVDKRDRPKGSCHSNRPSNSRETDDDKNESTSGGGIQVLFERPKPFEKTAFVEQVKKELEEWQARGEQTVNVEILEDANSPSSTEESDSNNLVTVYEDPKTPKKLDPVFDEASSNCVSEASGDSTEKFFLDLKAKEKPDIAEETSVPSIDVKDELEFLEGFKFDRTHKMRELEEYVAPIPLETTSAADIEVMWMKFVEMFHQNSESAKKLSPPCQETADSLNIQPVSKVETERIPDDRQASNTAYPGQYYLPYFVEESLRRVNSMLESRPFPNVMRKPVEICPPDFRRLKGDSAMGNNLSFTAKHFDAPPMGPPFHRHPTLPGKFSTKRSRIFFNPHASIGDWY